MGPALAFPVVLKPVFYVIGHNVATVSTSRQNIQFRGLQDFAFVLEGNDKLSAKNYREAITLSEGR